jgi:hypothetical protein
MSPNVTHMRAVPTLPPLPPYQPPAPVRPGERREPLADVRVGRPFIDAAAKRGLVLSVAVELAIERALVIDDLRRLRLGELLPAVLERAHRQRFTSPLPASFRPYRDALMRGEPRPVDATECARPVCLPLRFFPRALGLDHGRALTADGLDEARTLELAALCIGRTMSEYALYTVCELVGL